MPLPIKTNNLGSQGLTDGDVLLDLDDTTGSMQIMPYEHHEVHEGSHFFIEGYDSINDTDTIDFCFEVADTTAWPHLLFDISGSKAFTFDFFEGCNHDGDGSVFTPTNNNRNSSKIDPHDIQRDPTITYSGT